MKKLIFLLALGLFAFGANAQTSMTGSGDTIANTATKYLTLTVKGAATNVSLQIVTTKINGTVAGTSILQASLNGTNYVDISTDTLANTNVTTNTKIWNVTPNKYLYYRIKTTGVGTMSASHAGTVLIRQ